MTKRRPTLTRRPDRMTHAGIVLEQGPSDQHWLAMRDWMAHMDGRFDHMDGRIDQMEGRIDQMEGRFEQMEGRFEQMERRFEQMERRFDRMERRFEVFVVRTEKRFTNMERQIADVASCVKELAATVGGIDRRLCSVEGKVDDLVAWKHRIWGVVIGLGALSGAVAFVGSLLVSHVVS